MEIKTVRSPLLNEEYRSFTHKSGLRVFFFPKDMSSSYAIIAAKFGSADNRFRFEGRDISVPDGVAHFLEHKMFENEDGEDSFLKFGRYGAEANAFTGFSSTAYEFSATDNLNESLKVLLEMVSSPYFTDENVEKEQGIIAQEIKEYEDEPTTAVEFAALRCMYEHNAVRLPIAGTVGSISKITPEILYGCHRAFYNPSDLILCLCGKFDFDECVSVIDEVFGNTEKSEVCTISAAENDSIFRDGETLYMDVGIPLYCIGAKMHRYGDPVRDLKVSVASSLIGNILMGPSSELFNEFYESGLSHDMTAYPMVSRSLSAFFVNGSSEDPDKVYEKIKRKFSDARRDGIGADDFERNRRVLIGSFVRKFDNTAGIASSLVCDCEINGYGIFDYAEMLNGFTVGELNEILDKEFGEDRFVLAKVMPKSK